MDSYTQNVPDTIEKPRREKIVVDQVEVAAIGGQCADSKVANETKFTRCGCSKRYGRCRESWSSRRERDQRCVRTRKQETSQKHDNLPPPISVCCPHRQSGHLRMSSSSTTPTGTGGSSDRFDESSNRTACRVLGQIPQLSVSNGRAHMHPMQVQSKMTPIWSLREGTGGRTGMTAPLSPAIGAAAMVKLEYKGRGARTDTCAAI